MGTNKKNKEVRVDFLISEELRKKIKIYCIENNTNVSKLIRDFLEKTIENK